jgi:hypothetical protein
LERLQGLPAWKGRSVQGLISRYGYKSAFLIQAFMHTMMLSRRASLRSSIEDTLNMVFGTDLASVFVKQLSEKSAFPSASVISRFQLSLDVGYMLYMRDEFMKVVQTDGVIYMLSDSSPQGGRDWQLTEIYSVVQARIQCRFGWVVPRAPLNVRCAFSAFLVKGGGRVGEGTETL